MRILPNRTKSLFGNVPYIVQKKISKWNQKKNYDQIKILIVDDKDGQIGLCPLRYGIQIEVYEPNINFINGAKMEIPVNVPETTNYLFLERTIKGYNERINIEFLDTPYELHNRNYYAIDEFKEYEYVIACRSLSREENIQYDMDYKINKLKQNVKKDGYLYLEYYVALDENDYDNYPSNKYLRKDEILKYFPDDTWNVISNHYEVIEDELTPLNREKKNVVIGYLDVRKKPLKNKSIRKKTHKKIIDNDGNVLKVNHSYTINGCVR